MAVRSLLALVLALPIAACVSFAPTFDATIYDRLSAANSSLAKLETAIETKAPGKLRYSDAEGYYIDALAEIGEAQDVADRRPAYLSGQPSAEAARLSAANIKSCREAIEFSRTTFKESGQAVRTLDDLSTVRNTCAIPKTMEGMLK
ncbi:hypothetical protein [Rhizobium sp. BK251]|uniref:hypothetical protein n=1 Tax=Rhizobium sp. BK251 TaxID=2512125 RepID=UPI00104B105D|nr:hypothetical protein [Rhizobium sp. BK251]TCL73922.1 hypothetical protein EV286_103456 [Rhizobium sp. BK251]